MGYGAFKPLPTIFQLMTKTWWEAPMGGFVLSFLKSE
jgi:hypothetical protein